MTSQPLLRVAEAGPEDAAAFAAFFREAWRQAGPEAPGFTGATDAVIAELTEPAAYLARIGGPERRMFLAWDDGHVIGFAATMRIDAATIELAGVIVLETMTGRGAGRALVDTAQQAAATEGYAGMLVKTETDNTRALGFYTRCGFRRRATTTEEVGGRAVAVAELRLDLA